MNGWFPALNRHGEIASGAGEVFVGDESFGPGYHPRWIDDDTIVFGSNGTSRIVNVRSGTAALIVPQEFNAYAAGGGTWAGILQSGVTIVRLYRGTDMLGEWHGFGIPAMDEDGSLALPSDYQAAQHTVIVNGEALYTGPVMNLSLSRQALALQVASGVYGRRVIGVRRPGTAPEDWSLFNWEDPVVCDSPTGPWVLSVTQTDLVLRPAGDRFGYRLTGEWLNPAIRFVNGVFLIAASTSTGARRVERIDPARPRIDLVAAAPIIVPPINRPLWVGTFNFAAGVSPGNCAVAVRQIAGLQLRPTIVTHETAALVTGEILGEFLGGDTVEAIEQQAAATPHRPIAYWDGPDWPRLPTLPAGAWLCLQGYCRTNQSLELFEASLSGHLARLRAERPDVPVAIVAQAYTSNATLTPDPAPLVPIFARLAIRFPQVVALLVFSGVGRATGLNDHPALAALWAQLATTVTVPAITPYPEEPDMKPPVVTVDAWTLDQVDRGKEFRFHDSANPELGVAVRVWVDETGSMRASITNQKGSAETGARRAVIPCTATPQPEPQPEPQPQPQPDPHPPATTRYRLKTDKQTYLAVGADGFLTQAPGGDVFEIVTLAPGVIALRVRGKFVAAEGDRRLKADRDTAGEWERFLFVAHGALLSFKSWQGFYVSAHDDGTVAANQLAIGGWEQFTPEDAGSAALAGPIRIDGTVFVNDRGTLRLQLASLLTILTKSVQERRARMLEIRDLGFNGFRVFCGDVGWAGQTPDAAAAALPETLELARSLGLIVEVTALTGTASGYDARAYLQRIARIVEPHADHVLLESANEPWHDSQSGDVHDFATLAAWARAVIPPGVLWALGAPPYDEPQLIDEQDPSKGTHWPAPTGDFVTSHLDRSRPLYEQVRRVRELRAIIDETGKPTLNNEPIGAAEQSISGKRESNPTFFYLLGILNRGFEVSGVFHSEDGLFARPLGPNQRACAEAFIAGGRVLDTEDRLGFRNSGWNESPVARFDGGTRAYSFIAGTRGYTVHFGEGLVGVTFQNGWTVRETLVDRADVKVYRIAQ